MLLNWVVRAGYILDYDNTFFMVCHLETMKLVHKKRMRCQTMMRGAMWCIIVYRSDQQEGQIFELAKICRHSVEWKSLHEGTGQLWPGWTIFLENGAPQCGEANCVQLQAAGRISSLLFAVFRTVFSSLGWTDFLFLSLRSVENEVGEESETSTDECPFL